MGARVPRHSGCDSGENNGAAVVERVTAEPAPPAVAQEHLRKDNGHQQHQTNAAGEPERAVRAVRRPQQARGAVPAVQDELDRAERKLRRHVRQERERHGAVQREARRRPHPPRVVAQHGPDA